MNTEVENALIQLKKTYRFILSYIW